MKNLICLLLIALFGNLVAQCANAADWGSLKGRLVFDGTPAKPKAIVAKVDTEFCSQQNLVEETLVVGEKGGLSNVFVYLYVKKGKSVDIHPDLAEPSEKPAVLSNKGCRFEPRALIVRTLQPLEVRNSDEGIGHNTKASFFANPGFNETVTSDRPLNKVFNKTESYPAEVACSIHPWMKAFVLIRDNPYMAVSDAKGNFEIKNIPAGKHQFSFWHEAKGNLRALPVGSTKTDRKGKAKLEIKAEDVLDLGEIKVSAPVLGF
jgi:hypothetical protein